MTDQSNPKSNRMNRRRFLRAAMIGGAGLLASCVADEIAQEPPAYRTPTPFRALASPQSPVNQPEETVAEGSIRLEEFMQFSSLLTGVDNLDPAIGQVYLQALQSGAQQGPTLAQVYGAASSGSGPMPQDVDALSAGGFFDQEGYGALADQIINMWYSGVATIGEEEVVVTFVDSLAWKVLTFTKPLTICAQFGFWAEQPQADISPTIQYTPVPTPPGESGGG